MKHEGFNAMGKPVPSNRLQKAYKAVKEILGCNNETAWIISNRIKNYVQSDNCAAIIGHTSKEQLIKRKLFKVGTADPDELISKIDLTGRYRLLAEILTD